MSVRTGIEGFDDIIPGFPTAGLIIISRSPGAGKTGLAASFFH